MTNFLNRELKKMKKSVKPTRIYMRQSKKKKKMKRTYYSELFAKYKNDIKKYLENYK